ncbi:MAG: chitobiase/beta-hexosaminidase C-terminal domain-containing protein [Bacteroidales bacterium]|nr:chitobiase/beta-hexosaminidase C-terminal domain-containing protein [Bacteroidales bacterium]
MSSIFNSDSIYYTVDGSEPKIGDLRYSSPINISQNTIIRARSFNSEKLSGNITTNTYITRRHTLPVVCLSTEPANLWDYNTGIYVLGPNASPDQPNYGANFWEDWERKAHMELYDVDEINRSIRT